jgi:hypothetical protein
MPSRLMLECLLQCMAHGYGRVDRNAKGYYRGIYLVINSSSCIMYVMASGYHITASIAINNRYTTTGIQHPRTHKHIESRRWAHRHPPTLPSSHLSFLSCRR